jgi:hypothetical protein
MPGENNLGDDVNFQFVQSAYDAIVGPLPKGDIACGNRLAAQNDLGKLQGFATNPVWHDQSYATQAQVYLATATTAVQNMTADQETQGQAAFQSQTQAVELQVQRQNADPAYQAAATAEVKDIKAAQDAIAQGKDPTLAYNGIPQPSLKSIASAIPLLAGGTTVIVAGVAIVVGFLYLRSMRLV